MPDITADAAFSERWASPEDAASLAALMRRSIDGLLPNFLDAAQTRASFAIMGLDSQLLVDGTYLIVETRGAPVAGGGWSFRETRFGGDGSAGRSPRRLDPATEPARIRAMYVDPAYARRGLGRRVLARVEAAARAAGFARAALVATAPGRPLYEACGYRADRAIDWTSEDGVRVPLTEMSKALAG